MPGRNLIHGWKRDSYDPRDKLLHCGSAAPIPLLNFINLATSPAEPAIWDQQDEGSCTGHGTAEGVLFDCRAQGIKLDMPSRQAIYYGARALEGTVDQDAGAEIRDAVKAAAAGVGPESLWPYLQSNMYTAPDAAYQASATHKALTYQSVAQADYYIGYTLQVVGRPVIIGFDVFPAFESDEVATTGIVPMPGRFQSSIGGHCVVIVGRDATADQYIVRNSWGTGWGQKGYFRMPRKYALNPKLASDFWVISSES